MGRVCQGFLHIANQIRVLLLVTNEKVRPRMHSAVTCVTKFVEFLLLAEINLNID